MRCCSIPVSDRSPAVWAAENGRGAQVVRCWALYTKLLLPAARNATSDGVRVGAWSALCDETGPGHQWDGG